MQYIIPLISGLCYRFGGVGKNDRLFPFLKPPTPLAYKGWRWFMGIPIALIGLVSGKGLYILLCIPAYYIATAVFIYGDNSWIAKIIGVKWARIIHGLAFGMASLHPLYGIWCAVIFYIIFELGDHGILDNSYCEFLRGFLGTSVFMF